MATPPSTGYATASVTAGALLSDWTSLVDVSDMPAEWKALLDTSDGTKGRVFLDDGTTRLAMDPISFDDSAETGHFRFLIPTFSGVVPTTIRIYPPVAANSSVASGDLYGSDNARDPNWKGHWSLDEAVNNDVDGYKDSTQYGNHGTGNSMALPAVDGKVGKAAEFDRSPSPYIDISGVAAGFSSTNIITVSFWASGPYASGPTALSMYKDSGAEFQMYPYDTSSGNGVRVWRASGSVINENFATRTGFNLFCYVQNGATDHEVFVNGVSVATGAGSRTFPTGLNTARIGIWKTSQMYVGLIDDLHIHSAAWSADEAAEEHRQTDDNPTYWGEWVFVSEQFFITSNIIILKKVLKK